MKKIETNLAPAAIGPYSQGYIVNGLLFLPTLCCLNIIGPLDDKRTPIAATNIIGEVKTMIIKDISISIALFIAAFAGLSRGISLVLITGNVPTIST